MAEPINDAICVIRHHIELNLNQKSLNILPKAQQLHVLSEKQRVDYEKIAKDAQELVQRMKSAK